MVYEGPGGLCVPAHPYEMPLFAASAFRSKLHGLWLGERWCEAPAKHVHEYSYRHSSPHATALSLPDCCQGRGHIATLFGVHQFLPAAARALPAGASDCASGEWRTKHHPRRERAKARWQWWQRRHFRRLLPWNHRLSSSNKRPTGCPFLGQLVQEWPPSFATQQESLKPPDSSITTCRTQPKCQASSHFIISSKRTMLRHTSSTSSCLATPLHIPHHTSRCFLAPRETSSYIVIPTWYLGIPCGTT